MGPHRILDAASGKALWTLHTAASSGEPQEALRFLPREGQGGMSGSHGCLSATGPQGSWRAGGRTREAKSRQAAADIRLVSRKTRQRAS